MTQQANFDAPTISEPSLGGLSVFVRCPHPNVLLVPDGKRRG
jgi:hypothetical protein